MRERIFEPVGLASTSYPDEDDLSLPESYIHGYDRVGDEWVDCSIETFGRGDGAIVSTAIDTARFFGALLLERTLLPPELMAVMTTAVADDEPSELTLLGVPKATSLRSVGCVPRFEQQPWARSREASPSWRSISAPR